MTCWKAGARPFMPKVEPEEKVLASADEVLRKQLDVERLLHEEGLLRSQRLALEQQLRSAAAPASTSVTEGQMIASAAASGMDRLVQAAELIHAWAPSPPVGEVGERVRVYWPAEKKYFCGVVTEIRAHVKYDDGDSQWEDITELCVEETTPQRSTVPNGEPAPLKPERHRQVLVNARAHLNSAPDVEPPSRKRVRCTRTAAPGAEQHEEQLGSASIRSKIQSKRAACSVQQQIAVGERVLARYMARTYGPSLTKWYRGTTTKAHADGSFDIAYDDGDAESRVPPHYIRRRDGWPKVQAKRTAVDTIGARALAPAS
jgi:hypothetical protein